MHRKELNLATGVQVEIAQQAYLVARLVVVQDADLPAPDGGEAIDAGRAAELTKPPEPTYKELRAAEYNLKSTGEQFAMQYDDAKFGTTTWVDWQDEIKAAIPKP